ncbi:hypothetical protein [Rufibacter latericius]|uniref:Lipoprotein n=1 Tax=Rufibacter latericius TaxID=2487040 RepID=A0A3M9MD85_9BACT|nr:hypothetical protein [Rufibacter latericius]RNI23117.1 hypothetical protein EFB08_19560 [Rufibacter latericius]
MKKGLVYLGLILSLASCTEKRRNLSSNADENVIDAKKPLPLMDLKEKFKYPGLKSFEIDTFNWDTRIGKYQELDSSTFKLVWQDGKRNFVGQGYDRDYFYSWQKRNPELIEFTVLTQDESSSCDLLHYCIYDKNGKAINSFIVAASCGDGGWGNKTTGKFITENIYERISIDLNTEIVDSENTKFSTEGDLTVTHFTIAKDGKVTEKEISKSLIREEE